MSHQDEDTLSRVMITASVAQRWSEHARTTFSELAARGALPVVTTIPDERVRVEPDGSLTMYVQIPEGIEVSMRVEPGEWGWMGPRNQ